MNDYLKSFFNEVALTLYGLYLELDKDNKVERLYTPLGEVRLKDNGNAEVTERLSDEFMRLMKDKWELVDVTESMSILNIDLTSAELILTKNINHSSKVSFIKKINNAVFPLPQDHFCFNKVLLPEEQILKDKALFNKLSGGQNCFVLPKDAM